MENNIIVPESKLKEEYAKKMLKAGLSTQNIILAVKRKFGVGIGTTKLTKFRNEIKKGINSDLSMGSEMYLNMISKNKKLMKLAREQILVINNFIKLFLAVKSHIDSDESISQADYNDEIGRHLDMNIVMKYYNNLMKEEEK